MPQSPGHGGRHHTSGAHGSARAASPPRFTRHAAAASRLVPARRLLQLGVPAYAQGSAGEDHVMNSSGLWPLRYARSPQQPQAQSARRTSAHACMQQRRHCDCVPALKHVKDTQTHAHTITKTHQRPVIFTSLGALAPRSVSEGCTDSNTPAISPVEGSTLATLNTAEPTGRGGAGRGAWAWEQGLPRLVWQVGPAARCALPGRPPNLPAARAPPRVAARLTLGGGHALHVLLQHKLVVLGGLQGDGALVALAGTTALDFGSVKGAGTQPARERSEW
jgi:hypothetical protein